MMEFNLLGVAIKGIRHPLCIVILWEKFRNAMDIGLKLFDIQVDKIWKELQDAKYLLQ